MIHSLIKSVVTNSANDSRTIEYFVATDDEEFWAFRDIANEKLDGWNFGDHNSRRYIEITRFFPDEFADLSLDQLEGIPLVLLKKVLDQIPTEEGDTE